MHPLGRTRNTSRQARRACGRYQGNPMRTAGWFDARFFASSEPRFFSEPGFWSRSDALRRPERGAGLATCGAKIFARIFSPYVKKCWATAAGDAPPRQDAGALLRHRRHLQTRALRRPRLWLWQVRALVRNARNTSRQARRACGRYQGNPMRTAGWFDRALFCQLRAALLFGTRFLVSKRCFAPPRTGCRIGNVRRFGRSGRFVRVRRFV